MRAFYTIHTFAKVRNKQTWKILWKTNITKLQWNSVVTNSFVNEHSVITNGFLSQICYFRTQIDPVITNKNGQSPAFRYNRVSLSKIKTHLIAVLLKKIATPGAYVKYLYLHKWLCKYDRQLTGFMTSASFLLRPYHLDKYLTTLWIPKWKVLLRNDSIRKCVIVLGGIRTFALSCNGQIQSW